MVGEVDCWELVRVYTVYYLLLLLCILLTAMCIIWIDGVGGCGYICLHICMYISQSRQYRSFLTRHLCHRANRACRHITDKPRSVLTDILDNMHSI